MPLCGRRSNPVGSRSAAALQESGGYIGRGVTQFSASLLQRSRTRRWTGSWSSVDFSKMSIYIARKRERERLADFGSRQCFICGVGS